MCDYSLEGYASRDALIGEKLKLTRFPSGSVGLVDTVASKKYGYACAVCLKEGTVLSVTFHRDTMPIGMKKTERATFVRFKHAGHRDALHFDNGATLLLQTIPGAEIEVLNPAVKEIEAEALKPVKVDAKPKPTAASRTVGARLRQALNV